MNRVFIYVFYLCRGNWTLKRQGNIIYDLYKKRFGLSLSRNLDNFKP